MYCQDMPYNFDLDDNEFNEYQSLIDYYNILIQADTSNVVCDSSLLQQYRDLYNSGYGIACVYARNFLVHNDSLIYNEPIIYPDIYKITGAIEANNSCSDTDKVQFLKVMPNPARDYIIIEYRQEMESEAIISIVDLNGNNKTKLKINRIMGQEIVNTESWTPGVYIATIMARGKKLQSLKFSVIN